MKNSAASGEAAGQVTTLLSKEGGSLFFPWILIAPDDHSIIILPQIQDALVLDRFQLMLLRSRIVMGVIAFAYVKRNPVYHP